MAAVQELLGAEHVAGVGDPAHAVQDVDLGEGELSGHPPLLFLVTRVLAHLTRARLLTVPHSSSFFAADRLWAPPCCNVHSHQPWVSVHSSGAPR